MRKPGWQRSLTVRRSSVGTPIVLCLLIAALTGVGVFRWGYPRWTPVKTVPPFTATAYALDRSPGETPQADPIQHRPPTVHRVPFVVSDTDSDRAAQAADRLAEAHVTCQRAAWQKAIDSACAEARQKAVAAHRRLAKCESDLTSLRQLLAARSTPPQTATEPSATAGPRLVDNPEWVALNQERSELRRRYDDLLEKRTPAHPAVQDVAHRIEAVEQQLAVTRRQIPDSRAASASAGAMEKARRADRDESGKDRAEQARQKPRLDAAIEAVADARRDSEQAERILKQTVAAHAAGSPYAVERAKVVENLSAVDYGRWRLLATAAAAALAMGFGAGFVTFASRIELPELDVAQIRSDLGESVIGVMPSYDPVPAIVRVAARRRLRRVSLMVGFSLIVATPLVAMWGVLGI
ncbi:MAG: hypothetical protein ABFC63_01900 [Thermoguttaceae bacterium]